ncbi:MAG: DUF4349 domain-containing protein [Allosphingosinicella sp.]
MRKAFLMLLLCGTAACNSSQNSREATQTSSENATAYDVAEEPAPPAAPGQPPAIGPTSAPGVAFNYRYAFRLAGARIAQVQEQHAAACEKLGIARCRITGMRYRLVGGDDVEAMLAFKLDPAIARAFGRQGIDVVTHAEGMLVDSEITGEDAGARIAAATRGEADLGEELQKVEAQLAQRGRGASERAELQIRADQLRDQIRATRSEKRDQQESLATTPVVFNYGSGDLAPGFDQRPRLSQALDDALDNFVTGLLWILVALITLLPWAALIALFVWIWRRMLPRINRLGVTPPREAPPEA